MQLTSNEPLTSDEQKLIREFNEKYNNWYNTLNSPIDNINESQNKHYFLLTFLEENNTILKLATSRNIQLYDEINNGASCEVLSLNEMLNHVLFDNVIEQENPENDDEVILQHNEVYTITRMIEEKQYELLSQQDIRNALF